MENFLNIDKDKILLKHNSFFVIKDEYPVSPGHCLIISNSVKETFFDLTIGEKFDLLKMIEMTKNLIEKEYSPDGYNIGFNCGEYAGQSVKHFHCHVIPRYKGDMENPKGGIRYCIPEKGYY